MKKNIIYIAFSLLIAQNNPISDAGPDQFVPLGSIVQLDGSNSYDIDGDNISSYQWIASGVSLSASSTSTPSFVASSIADTIVVTLTVTDDSGLTSLETAATDIFISEYSEGSAPNQYIEIYNGTGTSINLDQYELWLIKGASDMSWNSPDRVLLFNTLESQSDIDTEETEVVSVNVASLGSGETLMILREAEDEDFDFVGGNYVVFSGLGQMGGDDAIALKKNGVIIDQVGEEEDPGSGWEVAGESTATKNHTIIRKGTVISGNTNWSESAGTNADNSEWEVNEQDYFDDIFSHSCTSCDNSVSIYVSDPPVANPSIFTDDGILLDDDGEVCDIEVTLDASLSTTTTGDISYQWKDDNNLVVDPDDDTDENEALSLKKITFSTIGHTSSSLQFGLTVYDGLLHSDEAIITVAISDNLCSHAVVNVVSGSDANSYTNEYPSFLIYDEEYFIDEGNGVWDPTEVFYDVGDFIYTNGEEFTDVNNNGVWDTGEPFLDSGNEEYDEGEIFDDVGSGIYELGEEFVDMNNNNQWDEQQDVILSAADSFDPDGTLITYQWDELTNLVSNMYFSSNSQTIIFPRPSFNNAEDFIDSNENGEYDIGESFTDLNSNSLWDDEHGELVVTLEVKGSNDQSFSNPDTLNIKFGRPSAPDIPTIYGRVENEAIVLSWTDSAEESVDYLTGYYDFEGYKLYKSTDGGQTWGDPEDKIYVNGEFVAWKPFRQWDFTKQQDEYHCIYSSDICSACCEQGNRQIDVSGYDPLSYWIDIGSNNGIEYSFTDSSVTNGLEYTYALTAYDTGVWASCLNEETGEMESCASNPNEYINLNGNGFPTLESGIDSTNNQNFTTLIPGYYASDIYFPSVIESYLLFTPDTNNIGHGLVSYELVNLDELEDTLIHFEVQASKLLGDAYEDLATKDPMLFAYFLNANGSSPASVEGYDYTSLLNTERDSLLDLPGAYLDDDMIYLPIYAMDPMEIKYLEDDEGTFSSFQHWTDFLSGARMRFINSLREFEWSAQSITNFSDPENPYIFFTSSLDLMVPFLGFGISPMTEDEKFYREIGVNFKYNKQEMIANHDSFDMRPPYTYRVEFSKTPMYPAYEVLQEPTSGSYTCPDAPANTLLPFKVINTYTGLEVGLRHVDQGVNFRNMNMPLLTPAGGCEPDGEDDYWGDCDCIWGTFEDVVFVQDTVITTYNLSPHPETTFSLEIILDESDWVSCDNWENLLYPVDACVLYGGVKWVAAEAITSANKDCPPGPNYCDSNQDGIDDGGSWEIEYPWSHFTSDSIYIEIEPWSWFADGDNWVADMSVLGQTSAMSDSILAEVTVTPNPYRRNSSYPGSTIRFSHLPTECEINIFTVSGERVITIQYQASVFEENENAPGNEYFGNYTWDVKNAHGEDVAPGLYIFTIEDISYEFKHIGKFAIVR